ncbi:MAG: NOB1 family endonuclease [Candidatus Kariarchaeaceae archaeon]|jgi:rRNA maturation endonuclease Nob1
MKVIIDSGVLMNIQVIPDIAGELYTCQSILREIKSGLASNILDLLSANQKIRVLEPDKRHLAKIDDISSKIGQTSLSPPDKDLLALALMLSETDPVTIISDDYGIRNVAHALRIQSQGFKTKRGNKARRYKFICRGCRKQYSQKIEICDICGTLLFDKTRIT